MEVSVEVQAIYKCISQKQRASCEEVLSVFQDRGTRRVYVDTIMNYQIAQCFDCNYISRTLLQEPAS
jgi:hypothetical protein